jgi:hypothetical protein
MREAFSLQASGKSLPKETAKLALMEICPSVSGDVSLCRRGRASLPASRVCAQWAAQQELRPTGGIYGHILAATQVSCTSRTFAGRYCNNVHFKAAGLGRNVAAFLCTRLL